MYAYTDDRLLMLRCRRESIGRNADQAHALIANTALADGAQLSDNGRGGGVAMSPSGRIWWTFEDQFQLFTAFPYMLAYKPR